MDGLLAAFQSANISDRESLVSQFGQIMGTDSNTAQFFLEASDWNVETALNAFLSSVGHSSNIMTNNVPQAAFLGDASVTTLRQFQPGEQIEMVWNMHNSGAAAWPAEASLVLIDGPVAAAQKVFPTGPIEPGQTFSANVVLAAPNAPGQYPSTWRMQYNQGYFGEQICVIIGVAAPTGGDLGGALGMISGISLGTQGAQGAGGWGASVPNSPPGAPNDAAMDEDDL